MYRCGIFGSHNMRGPEDNVHGLGILILKTKGRWRIKTKRARYAT